MRVFLGIVFLLASAIGTLLFIRYKGSMITYPFVWYLVFIATGLLGIWLIWTASLKTVEEATKARDIEIETFKLTAEKIQLNFDLCEFKNGSYTYEVPVENAGSLRSLPDTPVTEDVNQCSLIYNHSSDNKPERFISQTFPFDVTALQFYVMNNNITLYVNRFDRLKYFFDLKA